MSNGLTSNDVAELSDVIRKSIKPLSSAQGLENLNFGSTEAMDILDNLMGRVPSAGNMLVSPAIAHIMKTCIGPMIEKAKSMNDRYGEQVETDIDNGRYNRLSDLMKLSMLNQVRLTYGKAPQFQSIRDYVVKKYQSDIADPDGVYCFIPEKSEQTAILWHVVETLSSKGLLIEKEDVDLDNNGHKVTILMMARSVP